MNPAKTVALRAENNELKAEIKRLEAKLTSHIRFITAEGEISARKEADEWRAGYLRILQENEQLKKQFTDLGLHGGY